MNTRSSRKSIGSFERILLVFALVALGWVAPGVSAAPVEQACTSSCAMQASGATAAVIAPGRASEPQGDARLADLPPVDMPLRRIYASLVERANAGDADAAFRLFRELERCASVAEFGISYLTGGETEARCLAAELCRGDIAYQDHDGRRWDWLVKAAIAGHPEARIEFAGGKLFGGGRDLLAAHRYRNLYRTQVLGWMLELAQSGERGALIELAEAYRIPDGVGFDALGQLVQQDRARAAMYSWLSFHLGGPPIDDPMKFVQQVGDEPLSSDERAAAVRAAHEWLARHAPEPKRIEFIGALPLRARELPNLKHTCAVSEDEPLDAGCVDQ